MGFCGPTDASARFSLILAPKRYYSRTRLPFGASALTTLFSILYSLRTQNFSVRYSKSALCIVIQTFVCARREEILIRTVRIAKVGVSATGSLSKLFLVKFYCFKCNCNQGPFIQSGKQELKLGSFPECQSLGPFTVKIRQVRGIDICCCLVYHKTINAFLKIYLTLV